MPPDVVYANENGVLTTPLMFVIEVAGLLIRHFVLAVRLFANMLAGHIALAVFASFIPMLAGLGIAGYAGAVLPLGMVIALTALELLVAFLQAYVFTILTCIYLNDARVTDRLLNPKYDHEKTYEVKTKMPLRANFKEKMDVAAETIEV